MDNDTSSVGSASSTASSSLEKSSCPFCSSDFQNRSLFRHIRVKHFTEFIESCPGLRTAKVGKPLRVFYTIKDERGDDAYLTLYACLGTNKAFLQEQRCLSHFKKNPKALKEHNNALKELQDEYISKEKFDPYKSKLERMKKTNNPDFCRKLWSAILHFHKVVEPIKTLLPNLNPDLTTQSNNFIHLSEKYKTMTFKEAIVFIKETEDEFNKLLQEECLQYRPLENLYYRFQRILAMRESLPYAIPSLWPLCGTNEYGFKVATDEWGFGSPDWEQVKF